MTKFFEDGLNAQELRDKFLELCKVHHPDHGGRAEDFMALRKEYQERAKHAPPADLCPECKGSGRVDIVRGFYKVTKMCHTCRGTGRIQNAKL